MKKLIFLSLLLIVSTSSKCDKDKCHKTITFINNSSKEVYIHGGNYPDTLYFNTLFPNPILNAHMYKVLPDEKNTTGLWRRDCYESYRVANGSMVIYVFDAEIVEYIPWDTVGKYYRVLKTIHPTLEDMQNNDWTITYTGK